MSTETTTKMKAKDVQIVRQGEQIVIPKGMALKEAHEWIARKMKEDETEVAINVTIDGYPLDVALALNRALAKKYGWVQNVPTPGFFGPNPPPMIMIEVGVNQHIQVAWGRIQIPGVEGYIEGGVAKKDGRWVGAINGVVRQKHKNAIDEIVEQTIVELRERSVYKGKAIRVRFPDPNARFDLNDMPRFIDTSKVNENELIFSDAVRDQVKTNVFNLVERTELCRRYGVPLKRGVLLEGPYGTGKTMAAYVAAAKAEANGWTFLYLESVAMLAQAILFAQAYGPCVIFAEDIDQVLANGDRDEAVNLILNTIDGVQSKGADVMVVLTTNHIEKIHPAMLRPGRLDAVISVRPPDAMAAERLLRMYGRGLLLDSENLDSVCKELEGQRPAVIREVVERAKLAAIGSLKPGDEMRLTANDLLVAVNTIKNHMALLEPKVEVKPTAMEVFGNTFGLHVKSGVERALRAAFNEAAKENNGRPLPASEFSNSDA